MPSIPPPGAPPERGWVILDRDGVINRDRADYVKTPAELDFLPGSLEAIAALTRAGYGVVVATNQSGVGRGLLSGQDLDAIHSKLETAVQAAGGELRGVFVCPHAPDAGCACRKPRAGLLRQIATWAGIDLVGVPVVGDAGRDLEAARSVGALPILVRTGHGEKTLREWPDVAGLTVFADLAEFARHWITRSTAVAGRQDGA
jgi:D-glycero-D-manno-heptose 1,7-bisphosphate phosphatase